MTDELKYRIRFTRGTLSGQLFPLGAEPVILGRSHTCSIRLMEPDVSARHVMLSTDSKGVGMEVISSRRTLLDGTPLKTGDKVAVKAGQGVTMGGTASFEVECYLSDGDATEMPMGGDLPTGFRDETRKPGPGRGAETTNLTSAVSPPAGVRPDTRSPGGLTGADTKTAFRRKARAAETAYPGATATRAAPPPGGETEGTEAFAAGDATQVLRTRAATPQELAYMRELHNKKRRRRLWLRLALGLCLTGMAGGVYVYLALHAPERKLALPGGGKKTFPLLDGNLHPLPAGSKDMVSIAWFYPEAWGDPTRPAASGATNVFAIARPIGRARDVLLRLRLVAWTDPASLDRNAEESFRAWREGGAGGIQLHEELERDFFGTAPGIPCLKWTYQRAATESEQSGGVLGWAGVLSFFRLQDTCFLYTREVPDEEKFRAETLLRDTKTMLGIGPTMVRTRWAGTDTNHQYRTESLSDLANDVGKCS